MSIVGGVRSDCLEIKSDFSFLVVVIFGYLRPTCYITKNFKLGV